MILQSASIEDITRDIFKMTLQDETIGPEHHEVATTTSNAVPTTPPLLRFNTADETFTALAIIDHELHERTKRISTVVEGLDAQGMQENVLKMVEDELLWLMEKRKRITHLDTIGDEANMLLCGELTRNIDHVHAAVTTIKITLEARTPEIADQKSQAAEIIHTGEMPSGVLSSVAHELVERKSHQSFHNANPTILLSMVITLILNVFGHITRPWCNALLGLLNLLLTTILGDPTVETGKSAQSGGGYLSSDIRTVRKKFDLEPSAHTYATCPRCCMYPPSGGRGQGVHPEHCTFKKYRGSKPCGHLLVRVAKHGGTKVTQPIKPFVVQDYGDFVVGLLSRPSMEEAMERGMLLNDKHQLWDIKDGTAITKIQGLNGKIFMDGLKRSDLRLAWSLSIDWFNPQGNKTAGKKKSVGSIAMTILNLSPSLWYKPENIYLVGVIPGPKEPFLEEINHFLRLLVNFFLAAWRVGTWFTKTTAHDMGRLI
jgi:hypothetical protein